MASVISAKNLVKTYELGEVTVHALNDVSMELYPGELVVLLGHSGSGKSTLLNILGGLDRPSEGECLFEGEPLHNLSDSELTQFRRENVGFIFQMYNLIPRLTAKENVKLVTEIAKDHLSPEVALERVGLKERMGHFPAQLSGGEQQRVAIARAIAKKPKLLFCDEPTGALDVSTGILVLEAIKSVNEEFGTTTVIITHNISIAKMADRVIYLKDGGISEIKTNSQKISPGELEW